MNLNFETILDFYTHKNRKILCQIKVTTPPSTNHKFNNTCCRVLSQKQWNTFDKELEKIINTTNDDWNEARCLKFNINPCIEVKVQKSKLSLKHFYKCLGAIEDYVKDIDQVAGDGKEDNYVLECLINFQKEDPLNTPSLESQEYEPQINTTPDKLSSPLSYEPYTPSKKKYRADNIDTIKTPGIDLLESNEDTYSPKPIFPCASGEALIMETIPKYTPAPIKNTHGSKDNTKSLQHDLIDKIIVETGEEIKSLKSKLRNKKFKKAECEYIPKSQEFAVVDVPVYIPTPIGETTIRKDFKSDYDFKKHRKRSKTIDEFPGLLLNENTNENYKTINECVNRNDKHGYHYDNKMFKKRSRTIDEIPAGFAVNIEKIKNLPEAPFDGSIGYEPLIDTSTDILSSSLSYEPYTPSNKRCRAYNIDTVKTPGIDFLNNDEDKYSAKLKAFETSESEIISIYTPQRIETRQSSDEVIVETGDEIDSPKKNRFKKLKKLESEFKMKTQEIANADLPVDKKEVESRQRTDYDIKKHRKRAKTIDAFSSELYNDNSMEKHISKKERSSSRIKSIDQMPVGISMNIEKQKSGKEKFSKKLETTDKHKSNKSEDSKEKSTTKLESTDKHKSHKSRDTSKEKPSTTSESSDKKTSHKSEDSKEKERKKLDLADKTTSNKSEDSKEKSCKKLELSDKSTSHKSKEKKKDISSTIEKSNLPERKHERRPSALSSSEDEYLVAFEKSKKPLKTAQEAASDNEFEDDNKSHKNTKLSQSNDNPSNLNISISSATESNTDTSPQKATKKGKKRKETSTDVNQFVRRSERSPNKPRRFVEEQPFLLKSNKPKNPKTSPRTKELFGSDDDEEDYFEKKSSVKTNNDKKDKSASIFETPVSKKSIKSASSSSSSSTKKKRKRDKSSECEQEKRAMGNWLGKKKSSSSDVDDKSASTSKSSSSKSRPLKTTKKEKIQKNEDESESQAKAVTPTPSFELPSKEEMELMRNKTKLMQKENAILRAELDKMRTSPPKEVEFKYLQDIPVEDILSTFSIYQKELDEIYRNNCKRDYIKGHEGINHCFVIRLLPQNIQMKMLEKLTDVYSNTKSSTQATLFANALLPEWVIRVYMEKYKFNRQEAIQQIKAQEEFRLYVEEQSDNSFMFD